jgi:glycosyltransferase involved in cell wall biosynthesis
VGYDAIRALRNTTGLGNFARGVLRSLRDLDPRLDIHLYTPREPLPVFHEFARKLRAATHLPAHDDSILRLVPSLWRTFRLGRRAAHDGVQLYHGLTHEIPRDLPATGIPSVVTFADLIAERQPELFPVFDRWSYRWRYRWSARHANAIVAISARTRDDLVELYGIDPARITIIPPVRDPAFAEAVGPSHRASVLAKYSLPDNFVLSVGTLEPRKNHRVLLQAADDRALPPLVLVGRDGGSLNALRASVADRHLEDRVRILTGVASADLPAIVQAAAVFLYPSRIEGFGMPIVEALSAGVPVLAASGGHLDEAGGPGSAYLSPDDPAAWAAAIAGVLGNADRAESMRVAGRAHAQRFDGRVLAAQLEGVYDAVLAGQPVTP